MGNACAGEGSQSEASAPPAASRSSILLDAVRAGDTKAVETILREHSAEPSLELMTTKDRLGNTCLHLAAARGSEHITRLLLPYQLEASVSLPQCDKGWSPIHLASTGGHASVLRLLLQPYGQDLDRKSKRGDTALHRAAMYGHVVCVEELLAAGADRTLRNEDGQTPADLARIAKRDEALQVLQGAS